MLKKLFLVMSLLPLIAGCSSVPSQDQVKEAIKKIIPVECRILGIQEVKGIPGLVQVAIRAKDQTIVVYTDKKAKFLLSGNLMDLNTRANLTMAEQQKFSQQK